MYEYGTVRLEVSARKPNQIQVKQRVCYRRRNVKTQKSGRKVHFIEKNKKINI